MVATKDALREVFGPDRSITFYLSTRDPQSWLRSSYWQNLRASDLKMDFDTYADTFKDAADFGPILAETQAALGDTPLVTVTMEETLELEFGPATLLIDLFGLPAQTRNALSAPEMKNLSPDAATIAQILALNRSGLDTDTRDARKKALLADR